MAQIAISIVAIFFVVITPVAPLFITILALTMVALIVANSTWRLISYETKQTIKKAMGLGKLAVKKSFEFTPNPDQSGDLEGRIKHNTPCIVPFNHSAATKVIGRVKARKECVDDNLFDTSDNKIYGAIHSSEFYHFSMTFVTSILFFKNQKSGKKYLKELEAGLNKKSEEQDPALHSGHNILVPFPFSFDS